MSKMREPVHDRGADARYRVLSALSSDWHWELDAAYRLTGFEGMGQDEGASPQDWLGRTPWELACLNVTADGWVEYRAVLDARQPFRGLELERKYPQGGRRWLSVSGVPIYDDRGAFSGYLGVGRDITDRKKAELSTRSQLDFIRQLTSQMPGMAFQLRMNSMGWFSCPFASEGIGSLFGLAPQDVQYDTAPFMERILPQDHERLRQSLQASAQGMTPWVCEYRVRLPDDRLVWHAVHATPGRDAVGAVIWHGHASDITQRVESEQALRQAHEELNRQTFQMQTMLSSLGQGVLCFDVQGRVIYYNRRYQELLGFPGDLLERRPGLAEMIEFQYRRGDFGWGSSLERLQADAWASFPASGEESHYIRRLKTGQALDVKTRSLEGGGWLRTFTDVTDYLAIQKALQQSEERLHLVLQGSNDGGWDWNLETGEAHFSERWCSILGLEAAEAPATGALWVQWVLPDDLPEVQARYKKVMKDGSSTCQLEFRMSRKDGRVIDVLHRAVIVRNDRGEAIRMSGTLTDQTERKRLERRLEASEAQWRTLFDAVPERLWVKDPSGRFLLASAEVAQAFGTTVSELTGRTMKEVMPGLDDDLDRAYAETDHLALASGERLVYEQALPYSPGGDRGMFSVVKRAVFDKAGQPLGVLGIAHDITERKQAQARIEQLAFYDLLTGLCNRRLFLDRLEQARVASARHGQWGAVCFLDMDNFKDLNDTMGHDKGDALLVQVGGRLRSLVREEDTVARLGGDEFVVLLENLGADEEQAALYANQVGLKLLQGLNEVYDLDGLLHHSTPSIGITLFTDDQETREDVLKRADLAMYQSKAEGRNTVSFFDPVMQDVVLARAALERELRQTLQEGGFELHYQPVIHASGRVLGYEALLRWRHPQRGMVSPAEFIPVAEKTGLILPLGDWVLRTACERLAQWALQPETADWVLAVNLSARQLRQADFVETVTWVLGETGARADRLKLELTESLLLHDTEDTIEKMDALSSLGMQFALDDFGTGYSSLSYLKRLPLSQLKIDQTFVRDLLTDPNDAAIARTILQLARSLDLDVVAEGVETEGQRDYLIQMGCTAFQGYLFGRPAPM